MLIQECIASAREADGSLVVDAKRFPHGMKDLVDYVHSRGLKAGIYTDAGAHTCSSNPLYEGSYQHEDQDAATFAAWGMDFVEMDYCNRPYGVKGRAIYERMAEAIRKTGRPMLFYICSWGNESPWAWAQGTAQLWRAEGDLSYEKNHVEWSRVVKNFESNARHSVFSAPNSWNDPDMMEVGNPGLTPDEARTHFPMWAISAAPLWAGNNLTEMSDSIRKVYTNAEAIAIDQDPLGAGAEKVREYGGGIEVWAKPLGAAGSGVEAVLLLNLADAPAEAAVQWSDLGITGKAAVRDLWAHKELGEFRDGYQTRIPAHGSVLLKVSGEFSWAAGATHEAEWPGNIRSGNAVLLPCPACSRGYAVSLCGVADVYLRILKGPECSQGDASRGASHGSGASSLTFSRIGVPSAGRYWANLVCVYSGQGGKTVQMRVNENQPADIQFLPAIYGTARISVLLNQGENSITFSFAGTGSLDLGRLMVDR